MKALMTVLLFLALTIPVFADIAAPPPAVRVNVQTLKNGLPDTSVVSLVYLCAAANGTYISFYCAYGTCANSWWFYKSDPCYNASGYFTYEYDGRNMTTKEIRFVPMNYYNTTLDVENGSMGVQSVTPMPVSEPSACAPAFMLFALAGAAFVAGKN